MITRQAPALHPAYAHRIIFALYADLRTGRSALTGDPYEISNEDLADWITPTLYEDAQHYSGKDWLSQLGETWNFAWNPLRKVTLVFPLDSCRLQDDTAYTIASALLDDLRRRAAPTELIDAHLDQELVDLAQRMPPADWLRAAGAAWAQALIDDAAGEVDDGS